MCWRCKCGTNVGSWALNQAKRQDMLPSLKSQTGTTSHVFQVNSPKPFFNTAIHLKHPQAWKAMKAMKPQKASGLGCFGIRISMFSKSMAAMAFSGFDRHLPGQGLVPPGRWREPWAAAAFPEAWSSGRTPALQINATDAMDSPSLTLWWFTLW